MGTPAPARKPPAMPGPARLIRRSVLLGVSRGFGRQLAAERVLTVVLLFRQVIDTDPGVFTGWLEQLEAEARRQAGDPPPLVPEERTVSDGGTTTAG